MASNTRAAEPKVAAHEINRPTGDRSNTRVLPAGSMSATSRTLSNSEPILNPEPRTQNQKHGRTVKGLLGSDFWVLGSIRMRTFVMRWSQYFIVTLREVPADADVISQKLMMRAGMIRKVAAGIYTYLPLGLRSIRKMEAIIREEMNAAGAVEMLMPAIQPAELWMESKRWQQYGKELLRIKDRHERDFVFGPTHEEVITDTVRNSISSWRQLPVNLYQIQTKFRDEVRPRFGLMRGREFIMKDAYSFHASSESLDQTYGRMREAYGAIFR